MEPANGKVFTLTELQGFVGGTIEMVDLGEHTLSHVRSSVDPNVRFEIPQNGIIWLNEDGKGLGLPMNNLATAIFLSCFPELRGRDVINGDVLLATPSESDDEDEEDDDATLYVVLLQEDDDGTT